MDKVRAHKVTSTIILNNIASQITVSLESLEMLLVTRWERGLRNECLHNSTQYIVEDHRAL